MIQILLIEDNDPDALYLSELLRHDTNLRHELQRFKLLAAGLQSLQKLQPDVVLLDLSLPDSRGWETFESFHNQVPHLPIIILTNMSDQMLASRAIREGAQDYLYKDELTGQIIERAIRYSIERKQSLEILERTNKALKASEERFRSAFEQVAVGIGYITLGGQWERVNERLCQITDYDKSELCGMPYRMVVHPEERDNHDKLLQDLLDQNVRSISVESRFQKKDGVSTWVRLTISMVCQEGENTNLICVVEDITARKSAEEQVQYQRYHNTLTSLPNRNLLREELAHLQQARKEHPAQSFALLSFDLDRFKNVNDSLGHTVGDRLLSLLARRLEKLLRGQDFIAHLGGDEFAIVLKGLQHPDHADLVVERLQEVLSQPFDLEGHSVYTSASIGLIKKPAHEASPEELLRDVDAAMHAAKALGKSCHVVFNQNLHHRVRARHQTENDLRRAIQEDQLRVWYQPIINLQEGTISGFEALVRWLHPQRGLIPPFEFIGLAEETGLIVPLDRWVLNEACRQLYDWKQLLPDLQLTINVNLSGKQFLQEELIDYIQNVLDHQGVESRELKLELTESTLMDQNETTISLLEQLSQRHFCICLDDFGTGYSSLSYLHKFPVHTLKVDRSFIRTLGESAEGDAIVKTIITMAQLLKIDVVSEGIETAEHLALLRELGCGYGQGYFFSKPVCSEEATNLLLSAPVW